MGYGLGIGGSALFFTFVTGRRRARGFRLPWYVLVGTAVVVAW
jgi:hypothetical protein